MASDLRAQCVSFVHGYDPSAQGPSDQNASYGVITAQEKPEVINRVKERIAEIGDGEYKVLNTLEVWFFKRNALEAFLKELQANPNSDFDIRGPILQALSKEFAGSAIQADQAGNQDFEIDAIEASNQVVAAAKKLTQAEEGIWKLSKPVTNSVQGALELPLKPINKCPENEFVARQKWEHAAGLVKDAQDLMQAVMDTKTGRLGHGKL